MNFLKAYLSEKQKEVFALAEHFANLCDERVAENMESAENIWGFKFPEKDRNKLFAITADKIVHLVKTEENNENNFHRILNFYNDTLPYLACCSGTLEELLDPTPVGYSGPYEWGRRDMNCYMSRLRMASWSETQLFAIMDCISENAIVAIENEVLMTLWSNSQADYPEFWKKMSKYFEKYSSPWLNPLATKDEDNWDNINSEDACDRGLPRKDTSKGEKRYQSLLKEKNKRATRQKKSGKRSLSNHKRDRKTMNVPTGKSGYKKLNSYIQ